MMTDSEPTPALEPHEQNLRKLWRELAAKGIEQGVDYPRIVTTLFADIDATLAKCDAAWSDLVRINTVKVNAEAEVARLTAVVQGVREAAKHPHKGPDDTDATMLIQAAKRAEEGYLVGGSNTQQMVGRVLRAVSSLLGGESHE